MLVGAVCREKQNPNLRQCEPLSRTRTSGLLRAAEVGTESHQGLRPGVQLCKATILASVFSNVSTTTILWLL